MEKEIAELKESERIEFEMNTIDGSLEMVSDLSLDHGDVDQYISLHNLKNSMDLSVCSIFKIMQKYNMHFSCVFYGNANSKIIGHKNVDGKNHFLTQESSELDKSLFSKV